MEIFGVNIGQNDYISDALCFSFYHITGHEIVCPVIRDITNAGLRRHLPKFYMAEIPFSLVMIK